MNGHQNMKQMGRNNHLQTLFHTHSNILINCNWFWWMVIKIWSKWVETITSKHYFTLIPIFCIIEKGFIKIQSPPNTISHSPKNLKPNQAKSVREKKEWAIIKKLMNIFFNVMVYNKLFDLRSYLLWQIKVKY